MANDISYEWHASLARALMPLDECHLECDGMTNVISHLLNRASLAHSVEVGELKDIVTGQVVSPHFWIRLPSGAIIDWRAQMWLGREDRFPHGVFKEGDFDSVIYRGSAATAFGLSPSVVWIMTDGVSEQIQLTCADLVADICG